MNDTVPKRHFHDLLDLLQARLLEMAGEAEDLLRRSVEALLARDRTELARVREGDAKVDALELEVDERALELLALQQPLAKDLRQIVATLKVANDLERVGDHASKIAAAGLHMLELPTAPELPRIAEMAALSQAMLSDALRSWSTRDPELARETRARDDRVDALRSATHRVLVSHMLEDPRRITASLELLLVSQSLERVADLATNIAEETVFFVEGRVIRHLPEEAAELPVEEGRG
jgi:phosphate transport system protein